ncbi:hypothetical protein NON08_04315 [Cetobacterium somerae]|uniref:hypothetical protein n=1 Tax=Cetobacterium sp. NK01 TaxID=2993530 RepID=UPI0021164E3A|nr:hypothetical protein [Cetobacterium sp. NK01]MCQ8211778.1 hypothetical protein [Cetobacterium sp. NK01]
MRKRITLFLLLSIISIFGSIREEFKDRTHLYNFINSEIKELKSERKDKHILLSSSNKDNRLLLTIERNRKSKDKNDSPITIYLINTIFSPICSFNLNKNKVINFYNKKNLICNILNRYKERVLRI